MKQVRCSTHGPQGMGLACTHVAHAIDSGEQVGFFWGELPDDAARPDAWCSACEERWLARPPGELTDDWFRSCQFKILCAHCWDLAKQVLYVPPFA